jgi:predicted metal-dependent hydrolase
VDLFNHAFWWEAHEAWEGLWAGAEGTQRLFLQGLIQLAAALLKHRLRSMRGCVRLARDARDKLVAVCQREQLVRGERFMGVDVAALLQSIDAAFSPVFQAERGGAVPALAAPLVLELAGS